MVFPTADLLSVVSRGHLRKQTLTSSGRGDEDFLRQILPSVELKELLVVSLKGAGGFCLVKYSGTRSYKLLVKLPLVIASIPALSIEGLQRSSAVNDAVEGAHPVRDPSALVEGLHGS